MTMPTAPREPWDDRRLEAAFAVRNSTVRTPAKLTDETLDRVRSAPRPAPSWQRWLPAAAVVLVAVGLAAGGLALSGEVVGHRLFRQGPTADLRTFDNGEFAFEYPAAWLGYDASAPFSGGAAIAVIGTQPIESRCGDERHIDINCVSQQRLTPGHVRLYVGTGTYRGGTIEGPRILGEGMTRVEVGGMPAIFAESDGAPDSYYREDKGLHWEIARPGSDRTSVVELEALLTEPGVAEGREQLEALIASFRFTNAPDPSASPTPRPTPTVTPPRLSDLRVMTVEELIAAAMSPTPEEVVVRGWLARSSSILTCPLVLDAHPLTSSCDDLVLSLSDDRVRTELGVRPSVPHVVPKVGADAHVVVPIDPGRAVEVLAIGHLLDHRWTTCPEVEQVACKSRFVIDRLVPADQPLTDDIPRPWTIPSADPVGAGDALDVVRSVVGGITVVSIGVADMEPLRSIEPSVEDINEGQGSWVIRALVAGDAAPVARTFLVGHIGWWTLFEVTESGLIDRSPPVEGAPTAAQSADPAATFPPKGGIVVFLAKDGGFELPKIRAALVDLSGRVTRVRAPRRDEPRPIDLHAEGPAVLLPDPEIDGRFHLYWTGGVCDDEMVITIDASMSTVTVDEGHSPPCDAMGVERRLVIDVDGPLDPNAVELRYTETSAGAS